MTATEFKDAQLRLGLTNEKMSALLCITTRQVERMRQGTRAVSSRSAKLIQRELDQRRVRPHQ